MLWRCERTHWMNFTPSQKVAMMHSVGRTPWSAADADVGLPLVFVNA